MRLLIVRHGASEQRDAQRWPDDSRRPLTGKGIRQFAALAACVGRFEPNVDALLSSRYTRAWQTADLLTEHARWPQPKPEPTLESESVQDIAEALLARDSDQTVAAVGHQPTVGALLSLLLTGSADGMNVKFKKGAIVCMDVESDADTAQLRWMVTPKIIG